MPERGYLSTRLLSAQSDLESAAASLRRNILPLIPADREVPILEVGTGLGLLLDVLASEGYRNLRGIDVDAECVAACGVRHDVELVDDAAAYLRGIDAGFGVVVMKDVLPHLDRDAGVELLCAARGALAAGARLILEVFNAALPSGFYTFANDLSHRTAYTEHSLAQALRLGGFSRVEVRGAQTVTRSRARGIAYRAVRAGHVGHLRLTLLLERGAGGNPTIHSKGLIALARRD